MTLKDTLVGQKIGMEKTPSRKQIEFVASITYQDFKEHSQKTKEDSPIKKVCIYASKVQ